jgi:hypothetical protein
MGMKLSVPLMRFRGIPIRIHLTFGLLLLFLFWGNLLIAGHHITTDSKPFIALFAFIVSGCSAR